MKKKRIFILTLVFVLLMPVASTFAASKKYSQTFVYEFDTTLRSRDRTLPNIALSNYEKIRFEFNSVQCRKGHYMTVTVKHNVSWGRDSLLTKKKIPECGGTVDLYGYDYRTPVYFIISKPHDGYWVRGNGKIYESK